MGRRLLVVLLAAASLSAASGARAEGLQDDVDQAITILERFQAIPEKSIPEAVLENAKGLAIITVVKAGFVLSARGGKGVVVARTKSGWSGPSGIGTGGLGFGFQAGAQVSEYVIVLNTEEAVRAFSRGGNVTLGGNISAAVGPLGRVAEAGVGPMAAVYTYSVSQGLFGGISLEGTVIGARDEANSSYYGRAVRPNAILAGKVAPPAGARALQKKLSRL